MLNRNDYVTDATASGRYYPAVYKIQGNVIDNPADELHDMVTVRYVGDVVNGKLRFANWRDCAVTHRELENLRPYRG